jgi:4-diphosphocytidyl-2-C-methyl-D-erythritol kinase
MLLYPNAKINIGLAVKGKRADGYHNLESVFYPLNIYDALECIENKNYKPSQSPFLFTTSGLEIAGDIETNLVYKAYQLLHIRFGLPPVICHLHKHIPMGAGLGGGSSDGAYMLLLLNDLFELNLDSQTLAMFAQELGSDCPFFIYNKPAFVEGRGEVITPIDFSLTPKYFVLVYPDLHIGTKEAYEHLIYDAHSHSNFDQLILEPIENWKNNIYNHFEPYAVTKFPQIADIKNILYQAGAVYASMTGSGSAVFGIYDHLPSTGLESLSKYKIYIGNF